MTDYALGNQSNIALDEFVEHRKLAAAMPLLFPLYASSVGRKETWKVLTRRLSLTDRASIDQIPDNLQDFVFQQVRDAGKAQQRIVDEGGEPNDFIDALKRQEGAQRAADIFCMASFVDPEIVLEERQEDLAARKLWIGRIHSEDRFAFFMACTNAETEFAKRFERFRPQSVVDVPHREVEPVRSPTPIGDPGDGRSGHLAND